MNIKVNGKEVKIIKFSDGASNVEVPSLAPQKTHTISLDVKNCNDDIINLLLTVDAVKRMLTQDDIKRRGEPSADIVLRMNYTPAARADRVFGFGQALPIKVFADLINSCGFSRVEVVNAHSPVSLALINNVEELNDSKWFGSLSDYDKVCAPDLGASKYVAKVAHEKKKGFIQATKVRDLDTGKISHCEIVSGLEKGDKVIILDDICDGGATFHFLAKLLKEKGAERVDLYVTHLIAPNGLDFVLEYVDNIGCFYDMNNNLEKIK